jgi:hypothetical protein
MEPLLLDHPRDFEGCDQPARQVRLEVVHPLRTAVPIYDAQWPEERLQAIPRPHLVWIEFLIAWPLRHDRSVWHVIPSRATE